MNPEMWRTTQTMAGSEINSRGPFGIPNLISICLSVPTGSVDTVYWWLG